MKVVLDTEANKLKNPDKLWCVVCREVDQPENVHVFENLHESATERSRLQEFAAKVSYWIGHNIIGFDLRVLANLAGVVLDPSTVIDTLVVGRLVNYGIKGGHSLEAWGERLNCLKVGLEINDWSTYTKDILKRCIQDTLVNLKVFNFLSKYINNSIFKSSLRLEHDIAYLCLRMSEWGMGFDRPEAEKLRADIAQKLEVIDNELKTAFPPKRVLVRSIMPRLTKSGTIHQGDFRWMPEPKDLTGVQPGVLYEVYEDVPFDPGSLKQCIERLNDAGWRPTEKTKGHAEATKRGRQRGRTGSITGEALQRFKELGWKLTEDNLRTLPDTAPKAAQRLVERLLLASRISDLDEWLALTGDPTEGHWRVHGQFNGIGSWTHRLSHQRPNLANVPVAKHSDKETEIQKLANSINDHMRQLWIPRRGHRLIGVDADGIQMRIFAHYVNDERLTSALLTGRKDNKTDIHSIHQHALGSSCLSRDDAKTFIYAWLLGAGAGKVAEILGCTLSEAKEAIIAFLDFYPGLAQLKRTRIPEDAVRGYFTGLDGRLVACPDEHRVLAGYLQNGEAVVMKRAARDWTGQLDRERVDYQLVTWPHDEWQTEIPDDDALADYITDLQISAIVRQGVELGLNCPLAGTRSVQRSGFIGGYNWKETH